MPPHQVQVQLAVLVVVDKAQTLAALVIKADILQLKDMQAALEVQLLHIMVAVQAAVQVVLAALEVEAQAVTVESDYQVL
jgi:hypothetical protein